MKNTHGETIREELTRRIRSGSSPLTCISTGETARLKILSGVSAVVFDVYGTMMISGVGDIGVDDGSIAPEDIADAFERSGITFTDPDRSKRKSAGRKILQSYNETVFNTCEKAREAGNPHPEPEIRSVWSRVLSNMQEDGLLRFSDAADTAARVSVEFEVRMNPVWPMPCLAETLQTLRERAFILGIISNSQFYTPLMIEALAGSSLNELGFSPGLLHWSYEEGMKKPGMIFYEGFLRKLESHQPKLKPEHVLYVGNDMLKDILPAHKLGMKTALFAGDARSLKWREDVQECREVKPDLVVTDLKQIPGCLEERG